MSDRPLKSLNQNGHSGCPARCETEQLFAAFGEDIPEFEPTDWEFAAEEELIWFCDEPPQPRAGLRDDMLIQLDRIGRNRELAGRLTVAASFVIAAALVVFGPSHDATQTEAVAQTEPVARPRFQKAPAFRSGSQTSGPPLLVEASQATDSWALVDAYTRIREEHRNKLAGNLSRPTFE